jgi:hypothetical protein
MDGERLGCIVGDRDGGSVVGPVVDDVGCPDGERVGCIVGSSVDDVGDPVRIALVGIGVGVGAFVGFGAFEGRLRIVVG